MLHAKQHYITSTRNLSGCQVTEERWETCLAVSQLSRAQHQAPMCKASAPTRHPETPPPQLSSSVSPGLPVTPFPEQATVDAPQGSLGDRLHFITERKMAIFHLMC